MHLHITMTLLQPWTTAGAAPVVSRAGVTPTKRIWDTCNVLSERKNWRLHALKICTRTRWVVLRERRVWRHVVQAEAQSHCSRLSALMNRRFVATSTCNWLKQLGFTSMTQIIASLHNWERIKHHGDTRTRSAALRHATQTLVPRFRRWWWQAWVSELESWAWTHSLQVFVYINTTGPTCTSLYELHVAKVGTSLFHIKIGRMYNTYTHIHLYNYEFHAKLLTLILFWS